MAELCEEDEAWAGGVEDALAFLMRSRGEAPAAGEPARLEVAWVWRDLVLEVRHHRVGESVTWGERAAITWEAGQPVAWIALGADGFRDRDGARDALAALESSGVAWREEGRRAVPLEPGDCLVAEVADAVMLARLVAPARRVAVGMPLDLGYLGALVTTAVTGMFFGLAMAMLPAPAATAAVELPARFAQVDWQPPPPPASEPGPPSEGGGEPAEGPATPAAASSRPVDDRAVVESAGLLAELGAEGPGNLADRISAAAAGLTGPRGADIGASRLGPRQMGDGGRYEGLSGPLTRGPTSSGTGLGLGPRPEGQLEFPGPPITVGAMDRRDIDEVVRRHLDGIRYCYQRQLQRGGDLGGRLVVRFTIAGDGSVSSATAGPSPVGREVEACIEGRFLRMGFPAPRGGGVVVVSYPFLFSS